MRLGISAWVGIRFPYHPIALARRWEQRRSWKHMLARWTALVLTPYGLVPFVSVVLIAPSILLWNFIVAERVEQPAERRGLRVGGAAATATIALTAFFGGHRLGVRWARRRQDTLGAYLADPDLG